MGLDFLNPARSGQKSGWVWIGIQSCKFIFYSVRYHIALHSCKFFKVHLGIVSNLSIHLFNLSFVCSFIHSSVSPFDPV
jgi:hypothetical protein